MPPNEVDVKLIFTRCRSAKEMGRLAESQSTKEDEDTEMKDENKPIHKVAEPKEGDSIQCIPVTQQNSSKIVAPEDLATYTPLRTGSVSSRLHVPYVGKVETLSMFLHEMSRDISEHPSPDEEGVITFGLHGGQVCVNS
jgi:cleavage and polyadenylation specificity factor subunit 3